MHRKYLYAVLDHSQRLGPLHCSIPAMLLSESVCSDMVAPYVF